MKRGSLLLTFVLLTGCIVPRGGAFRVVPGEPDYLLRSPDGQEASFSETLRRYNGFERGRSGMELLPKMELRIENAYYQEGKPKRGLDGYLGIEMARYRVQSAGGLKLLAVQSMNDRPADQSPVQQLIPIAQQRYRHLHFYFEVLFKKSSTPRGSVVLGADSVQELNDLTALLNSQPDVVCDGKSAHCTVFPEACSVSVEMAISVNGVSQIVVWGSTLDRVVNEPKHVSVQRVNAGREIRIQLDAEDPNALKLPLLPGDRVEAK